MFSVSFQYQRSTARTLEISPNGLYVTPFGKTNRSMFLFAATQSLEDHQAVQISVCRVLNGVGFWCV